MRVKEIRLTWEWAGYTRQLRIGEDDAWGLAVERDSRFIFQYSTQFLTFSESNASNTDTFNMSKMSQWQGIERDRNTGCPSVPAVNVLLSLLCPLLPALRHQGHVSRPWRRKLDVRQRLWWGLGRATPYSLTVEARCHGKKLHEMLKVFQPCHW